MVEHTLLHQGPVSIILLRKSAKIDVLLVLSLPTTVRETPDLGIAVLARTRRACHAIERLESISAHFSASKSVEVRPLGSLIRAFSGWSKAAARVAAVLRNAGVIMLVRRDILSKRGFLAGRGRLVPDGERHEHDSHQNGVLAALLVSRRPRHAKNAPHFGELPQLGVCLPSRPEYGS